jgi:hypothetical protein
MRDRRTLPNAVGVAALICAALAGCDDERTTSGVDPSKSVSELTSEELGDICEFLESRDAHETYCRESARRLTGAFFDEERCVTLYEKCLSQPREAERACRSVREWKTCQDSDSSECVVEAPDGPAALLLEFAQSRCDAEPIVREVERCIAEQRKWVDEAYACASELEDIEPPACWTALYQCR